MVRLCDGQESLGRVADLCLGLDAKDDDQKRLDNVVDILDVIHVSGYVWLAGRALSGSSKPSVESFVWDRLLRILQGQAAGVIRGMCRMATERGIDVVRTGVGSHRPVEAVSKTQASRGAKAAASPSHTTRRLHPPTSTSPCEHRHRIVGYTPHQVNNNGPPRVASNDGDRKKNASTD
ncbi:MAG: hypothetical protein ABI614_29035 [Planctomycetota bacterium]